MKQKTRDLLATGILVVIIFLFVVVVDVVVVVDYKDVRQSRIDAVDNFFANHSEYSIYAYEQKGNMFAMYVPFEISKSDRQSMQSKLEWLDVLDNLQEAIVLHKGLYVTKGTSFSIAYCSNKEIPHAFKIL